MDHDERVRQEFTRQSGHFASAAKIADARLRASMRWSPDCRCTISRIRYGRSRKWRACYGQVVAL